jgi:RNA recognition motif-containing protein
MSVVLHSGTDKGSRGTAYVVYEDIYDAKQALEHLGGFNVQNRYLILQVGQRRLQRVAV